MPNPEFELKVPPEQVKQTETRFDPEVEKRLQEVGVQVKPDAPEHFVDKGKIIAQSTDPDLQPQPAITIPASQETITKWAAGNPDDSQTWLGKFSLRRLAIAFHKGVKRVVVGGGK